MNHLQATDMKEKQHRVQMNPTTKCSLDRSPDKPNRNINHTKRKANTSIKCSILPLFLRFSRS